MEIHRLNPSSVASRFKVPFHSHFVTVSSPVDRLVRRTRESFLAFEDIGTNTTKTCDHLQVMHADTGWHILRNGNILARCPSLLHASRRVRHATIHSFICSRPDLLWLHAGAVSRGSGSVLFVGDSGAGKSTFVIELCRRGWRYMSDDVVPVDTRTGSALPFPLTPSVRTQDVTDDDAVPQDVRGPGKKWVQEPLERIARDTCPVEAIIFLEFDASSEARMERLTARYAEALLTERVINHGHDGGAAFQMLTQLSFEKPTWLFRHPGRPGCAETILQSIDPFPEALAV